MSWLDPRRGWSDSLKESDKSPEEYRAEGAATEREKIRMSLAAEARRLRTKPEGEEDYAHNGAASLALADFAATLEEP